MRTLLIVTTLLGIMLAVVGNVLIHVREESAIAEQIKKVYGSYYFQNAYAGIWSNEYERDQWNGEKFGEHTFRYIRHVHLFSEKEWDGVLPLLPKLARLEALDISAKDLTAENLHHIANCRRLQTLVLQQRDGEFASLGELRRLPNLRQLKLHNLAEARLVEVAALPHVDELTLHSTHTSLAVLAELKRLPKLKKLEIDGCADEAHDVICATLVGLNQLETLILTNVPLNSQDLRQLAQLPMLRQLHLMEKRPLSVESAASLRYLTKLRRLSASGYCTDESLTALAGMPELEYLSIYNSNVTDARIPALCQFPKLRELHVSGTKLTAGGVMEVVEDRQLRQLSISHGLLSHKQQQALLRRKPPCFFHEH